MKTFIRVKELTRVFGRISESNFEAKVARLGPLYEDLRIEIVGIAEETIEPMDRFDARYRRNYFLRRSIATLLEFAEAIRHVDECPEFDAVKRGFPPEIARYWNRALAFFKRADDTLKSFRNDFGGHFGLEAARWAALHLDPDAVERIEIGKYFYLHFTGEFVATAMLRHGWGVNRDHKIRRLVRLAMLGYRHATRSVHCVVTCYLWDKFG